MTKLTAFIRQRLAKLVCDRTGSIAIITAGYFIVVLGAAGLGTEVSYWYVKKRSMQGAADSGAFAAAAAMLNGDTFASGNPSAAADAILASYGYTSGTGGNATIYVGPPVAPSAKVGDPNAVEVDITQTQPRLISALFMPSDPSITAHAVATQVSSAPPSCIITLDKGKLATDVDTSLSANLSMPDCNMFISSPDPAGALTLSSKSTVSANATYVNGAISGGSGLTDANGTFQRTGVSYADPYGSVPMPKPATPSTCDNPGGGTMTVSSNKTLLAASGSTPGTYVICGGITVNSGVTLDLGPGTYIVNGTSTSTNANQFLVNGGTVTCSTCNSTDGVTIVLTGNTTSNIATVDISGGSTVTLSAPPAGATTGVPGIAFFQDRNASSTPTDNFSGGATMNITGAVYIPNQLVDYSGGAATGTSGAAQCTQIVAFQLDLSGNTNFNSTSSSCNGSGILSLGGTGGPTAISLVE